MLNGGRIESYALHVRDANRGDLPGPGNHFGSHSLGWGPRSATVGENLHRPPGRIRFYCCHPDGSRGLWSGRAFYETCRGARYGYLFPRPYHRAVRGFSFFSSMVHERAAEMSTSLPNEVT